LPLCKNPVWVGQSSRQLLHKDRSIFVEHIGWQSFHDSASSLWARKKQDRRTLI
jgi:hypothetical protein